MSSRPANVSNRYETQILLGETTLIDAAGRLVGIVTAENITEYLMIHSAIRASG